MGRRGRNTHVRDRAQRRKMLDRLVGRAVFAEADGIGVNSVARHPVPRAASSIAARDSREGEEGRAVGAFGCQTPVPVEA